MWTTGSVSESGLSRRRNTTSCARRVAQDDVGNTRIAYPRRRPASFEALAKVMLNGSLTMVTAAVVVFIVKFWPAIIGVIGLSGAALFGWLKTKPSHRPDL